MRKSNYDKILDSADDLFYSKGFDETSMSDIASKCGLTKQALTYHFKSKNELGRLVCERYANNLVTGFANIMAGNYPSVPVVVKRAAFLLWFCADFYTKDPFAYRFYKEYICSLSSEDFDKMLTPLREVFSSFVSSQFPDSETSNIPVKIAVANFAGRGLICEYVDGRLKCDKDSFTRAYFDLFFSAFIQDKKEADDIYESAKHLLVSLNITVLPRFRIQNE